MKDAITVKIVGAGKFPNSFICENSAGKTVYLSGGKFLNTPLTIGCTYDVETFQKEGQKTVYINKASLAGQWNSTTSAAPVAKPATSTAKSVAIPPARPVAKVVDNDKSDKMTKADWEKKDQGIKWLTCLKASADFNASKDINDVKKVIDDAIKMYYADPASQADGVITSAADLTEDVDSVSTQAKDIFEENDL